MKFLTFMWIKPNKVPVMMLKPSIFIFLIAEYKFNNLIKIKVLKYY